MFESTSSDWWMFCTNKEEKEELWYEHRAPDKDGREKTPQTEECPSQLACDMPLCLSQVRWLMMVWACYCCGNGFQSTDKASIVNSERCIVLLLSSLWWSLFSLLYYWICMITHNCLHDLLCGKLLGCSASCWNVILCLYIPALFVESSAFC